MGEAALMQDRKLGVLPVRENAKRLGRSVLCCLGHRFVVVLGLFLQVFSGVSFAEEKFADDFNRPEGAVLGNGWEVVPLQKTCTNVDEESQKSADTDKESKKEMKAREGDGAGQRPQAKAEVPAGAAMAEISNSMLYLHYGNGQSPVMVQRLLDKKVTRLSMDLTPLYAMAGEDDRASMVARMAYLDYGGHVLGEIQYHYYNVAAEVGASSDTLHIIKEKGGFEGEMRHVSIDAGTILQQKLRGVDARKIARTQLSFAISSGLCGATVEGYVDNVVATLADGVGLMRLNKEEIKALVDVGMHLHGKESRDFAKTWVDALIKAYGREKVVGWLSEIPQSARTNPDKLLALVKDTYGLSGREAFETAFAIQYLLHAM
ncbi:MAG: hypothetical protein HQL77_02460 [Magnetococcales bacterium]|nr:hypothetical protein [Magnetococcales bacterium]